MMCVRAHAPVYMLRVECSANNDMTMMKGDYNVKTDR